MIHTQIFRLSRYCLRHNFKFFCRTRMQRLHCQISALQFPAVQTSVLPMCRSLPVIPVQPSKKRNTQNHRKIPEHRRHQTLCYPSCACAFAHGGMAPYALYQTIDSQKHRKIYDCADHRVKPLRCKPFCQNIISEHHRQIDRNSDPYSIYKYC